VEKGKEMKRGVRKTIRSFTLPTILNIQKSGTGALGQRRTVKRYVRGEKNGTFEKKSQPVNQLGHNTSSLDNADQSPCVKRD